MTRVKAEKSTYRGRKLIQFSPRIGWGLFSFLLLATLILLGGFLGYTPYEYIRAKITLWLGYSIIPVSLWVLPFSLALWKRPRLIWRHWRLWLGTLFLSAAAVAILAYTPLAEISNGSETMGGKLGLWVLGQPQVAGLLKVLVLVMAGMWTISPKSGRWTLSILIRILLWLGTQIANLILKLWARFRIRLHGSLRATDMSAHTLSLPLGEDQYKKKVRTIHTQLDPVDAVLAMPLPEEKVPPARPSPKTLGAMSTVWKIPPISLLNRPEKEKTLLREEQEERTKVGKLIEVTLRQYGVEVEVSQIKPGPTVTRYGLVPGWTRKYKNIKEVDSKGTIRLDARGKPIFTRVEERSRIKVDAILSREKDLSLALAVSSLRMEAPVPGESVVGIEVPNHEPTIVSLREVLESPILRKINEDKGLAIALGQGAGGEPTVVDLRDLPHLLIAGATGSGKSVCVNALICSLIAYHRPQDLRLILIDPKRVELTPFNGIPHLVVRVIVETDKVVRALRGLIREMFRRYKEMERLGVRNIEGFNKNPNAAEMMPHIVVAIDELADIMMGSPYDAEQVLCRLAQLGRATGIHLIIATQRPSVDVITGLIKANFPSRASFDVVSQVDSRTILDTGGAEKLLGRGDMLFLAPDSPKPRRIQGCYVSDDEVDKLVAWWVKQAGPNLPVIDLEEHVEAPLYGEGGGGGDNDMFRKAKELATRYHHLSTSLLQRRLRIGYPRAARLMDQLEDDGIVGPGDAGKPREVLVSKDT